MLASLGSSTISRLGGAVAALWLCGAGSAWAGSGGGADLGSLQALLSDPNIGLCKIFNMSFCPKLPTVTQAVLQVAALGNNLPEMIRAQNNIPAGTGVTAGNPAAVPPVDGSLTPLPLTSTTTPTVSDVLSTLTPLAFISQDSGTAQVTQLYDPNPNKDTFLYAVGVSSFEFTGATGLTDPDMAYFFYEDIPRTQNFTIGQVVAKFSFPLAVLNKDGTERAVPITLHFIATNAGDCSASTVVGDFKGNGTSQTLFANTIGVDCAVVFSASPTSSQNHAIFEVAVPLLVTGACILPNALCPNGQTPPGPNTDPAYFYSLHNPGKANPINTGVFTAFVVDDPGDTPSNPGILGSRGKSIGLAPTAPPFCTSITCPPGSPPPPPPAGSITFALCASLPSSNGTGVQLRPAVGAFYAMATSGEMFLSAPLPPAFNSGGIPPVCPQL